MTMTTLALIGIGRWGKNFLSTVKNIPECQIKYVCSKTDKNLKLLQGNFHKTTNYKDLLKFKDIDGVIIATSGSTHFEIAKEFLQRGFNLLIEKPLTLNYSDALKLKALRDKTGAKVLVGHVYLFDPAYRSVKELFKNLGKIRYISYESVNNGPYRDDMSILWDMGPHPISILLDLYEENPVQIQAWALDSLRPNTKLYDVVIIKMRFSDGNVADVKLSWLNPFKSRELIIIGDKDAVVYNDLSDKRVTSYKNIIPEITGQKALQSDSEESHPAYGEGQPLEMEVKEFIEAIKERRDVKLSDLNFGVKVTKLLQLVEESIKENSTVKKVN